METVLWFNWSSCNQQDSNIASKEMTVKKASSLKTERGDEMQLLNNSWDSELLPARETLRQSATRQWREGSGSAPRAAPGARGQGERPHLN